MKGYCVLFLTMFFAALLDVGNLQRTLRIPRTKFSCRGRATGYYADLETGCQVYHMCDGLGRQFSYACPNTTLFQQRMLICDHWYMVNCSASERDYSANLLIGQKDKPFVSDDEDHQRTPRPDILSAPVHSHGINYYGYNKDHFPEAGNRYDVDDDISNGNNEINEDVDLFSVPTHWSTELTNSAHHTTASPLGHHEHGHHVHEPQEHHNQEHHNKFDHHHSAEHHSSSSAEHHGSSEHHGSHQEQHHVPDHHKVHVELHVPEHHSSEHHLPHHSSSEHHVPHHSGEHHVSHHSSEHHVPHHSGEHHVSHHSSEHHVPHHSGEHHVAHHPSEHHVPHHSAEHHVPHHSGEHHVPHHSGEHHSSEHHVPHHSSEHHKHEQHSHGPIHREHEHHSFAGRPIIVTGESSGEHGFGSKHSHEGISEPQKFELVVNLPSELFEPPKYDSHESGESHHGGHKLPSTTVRSISSFNHQFLSKSHESSSHEGKSHENSRSIEASKEEETEAVVDFINRFIPNEEPAFEQSVEAKKSPSFEIQSSETSGFVKGSSHHEKSSSRESHASPSKHTIKIDLSDAINSNELNREASFEESHEGVAKPSINLVPPKTKFSEFASTTVGPPIYYEWKWAPHAFGLEPPKFSTENRERHSLESSHAKKEGRPEFAWARSTTPRTLKEHTPRSLNLDKKENRVPDNDGFKLAPYFISPFNFPLEQKQRGYEEDDNVTSFQVKIPRASKEKSSENGHPNYGENEQCPHCHPSFLEPGKCTPCVMIKR